MVLGGEVSLDLRGGRDQGQHPLAGGGEARPCGGRDSGLGQGRPGLVHGRRGRLLSLGGRDRVRDGGGVEQVRQLGGVGRAVGEAGRGQEGFGRVLVVELVRVG